MNTLIMSDACNRATAANEIQSWCDTPNTIVNTPNSATAVKRRCPTCRPSGFTLRPIATTPAPTPPAARSSPNSALPTCSSFSAIGGQQRDRATEQHGHQIERDRARAGSVRAV